MPMMRVGTPFRPIDAGAATLDPHPVAVLVALAIFEDLVFGIAGVLPVHS